MCSLSNAGKITTFVNRAAVINYILMTLSLIAVFGYHIDIMGHEHTAIVQLLVIWVPSAIAFVIQFSLSKLVNMWFRKRVDSYWEHILEVNGNM